MKKEQFYNFEGEDTFLGFSGEEDEFDEFLGKKAKKKNTMGSSARRRKPTAEEIEAKRLKSEMIATFKKEFLALGYSDLKSGALARKKYKEWLQQQPQSTINFFGMIDDEEENEFDEFLGIGAAIKAGKRLKELTNAEEARMAQIEQDLRNSGALPGVAKVKAKATILLEIQKRKKQ